MVSKLKAIQICSLLHAQTFTCSEESESLTSICTENDEKKAKWEKKKIYRFSVKAQILISFNKPQSHYILAMKLI